MPKIVNPIVKQRIKKSLMEGKTDKQAALDGGLTPSSAWAAGQKKIVIECKREIEEDVKKIVTVEFVLKSLLREARKARNSADRTRATELLGKYLAMFTDKNISSIQLELTEEEKIEVQTIRNRVFAVL